MELHRLIFRVDYPAAFKLFDQWGSVLARLNANQFWNNLSESPSIRTIVAKHLVGSGSEMHDLNVAVNATAGIFEAHPIASHRDYLSAFDDVTEIVNSLGVEAFNRLGVRFLFLEPVASFKDGFDPIVRRVNDDYWRLFEDSPNDISLISIHGSKDQSLRLTVGPISQKEYRGWFNLPDQIRIESAILLDVDCYAVGYKFKSFDLAKVVELYFSKAFSQAAKVVDLLKGKG